VPHRLLMIRRELQCFLNDRLAFRTVTAEEIKALAKLREALSLVLEANAELAALEHRTAA
jgi:hypothetical protein